MGAADTWALVTDGIRARILRNLGQGSQESPAELVSRSRSAHLLAHLSNHPGRAGPIAGLDRDHMLAGKEVIRNDAVEFIREVTRLLDQHRVAGDFDRLAVFAPAEVLTICRSEAPPKLAAAITVESPADIVRADEPELRLIVIRALRAAQGSGPTPPANLRTSPAPDQR